jgi:CubicO group peptidase (beta-lactamase class C family)
MRRAWWAGVIAALLPNVAITLSLPAQQPAWRAAVDSVFRAVDRTDAPGCALGVVQRGELVYARGYGLASLEHRVPITPATAFYIASTSKQFTAAAVALLAMEGTLDLDGSIRRWIPELPAWADSITVRHLVHHTSGVRDYLSLWRLSGRTFNDAVPLEGALALIARQQATNFPPGTRHLYSNSGYLLLAVLVERVTGQSLNRLAAERFFQPAGMIHTRFRDDAALPIPDRADGHVWNEGRWQVFRTSFDLVGDGGLVTTVEDLARWERWFWLDSARAQLRARVLARGRITSGDSLAYAFGLTHGNLQSLRTVSHGGSFLGFLAEVLRVPERQTSIIALCNTVAGSPVLRAREAAQVVLGLERQLATPGTAPNLPIRHFTPDSALLRSVTGRYSSDELDVVYTIAGDSGQVRLTAGALRGRLIPEARDTFRLQNLQFAFTRDRRQRVNGLILSEGRAQGIRFVRLPR